MINNQKIGFLFPGQGAQKIGMGFDFYSEYPFVKQWYDSLEDQTIVNACFDGPIEKLTQTNITQPAIFLTSYMISQVLKQHNIRPHMVTGLSLGELTALTYAQGLSFSDAYSLVQLRGELMQNSLVDQSTSMIAVLGCDKDIASRVCREVSSFGVCEIAIFSYPNQVVLTGHSNALQKASELCKQYKAKRVIPLHVAKAFHSSLLKKASTLFLEHCKQFTFNNFVVPVVFNSTAKSETDNIAKLIANQISSTVYFQQSIEYMIQQGIQHFIEIGPGQTLSGYVRKIDPSVSTFSIEKVKDIDTYLKENYY